MNVIGISFGYHDSSVCLLIDGKVAFACSEERLTRQKHDANFPRFAFAKALEVSGLTPDRIDKVIYHEDPFSKYSRVFTASMAGFPATRKEFVNSSKAWLGSRLWALDQISSELKIPAEKIHYSSHHFSHAAQAFLGSGYSSAAILVMDAVGDWSCTGLYRASWKDSKPEIERIEEYSFPHSIGLLYSAITAYLGFQPNDSEASTMALAAFGNPAYLAEFEQFFQLHPDGSYSVDPTYFHFLDFYRGTVSEKFLALFGPPRPAQSPIPFSSYPSPAASAPSASSQRYADIAATLQVLLERVTLGLARRLALQTGEENLCLAGGVAMNCAAMGKLLQSGEFKNYYMPPDPGDGGTSIGNALYFSAREEGNLSPASTVYDPYLGFQSSEAADFEMLKFLKPKRLAPYLSNENSEARDWDWLKDMPAEALLEKVATELHQGKIVGWFQHQFEFGPRALGNRSILIRPDNLALANRLSERVKQRAGFRPYAISLASVEAEKILDIRTELFPSLRWMQFASRVKPEARALVSAGIHIDGTTRPQVLFPAQNPRFHALLLEFKRLSGLGVLINTSFNPSGYPLVSTVTEALLMFARSDMDVLVVNNSVIWKKSDAPLL